MGTLVSAGLPNITGYFGGDGSAQKGCINGAILTGPFYKNLDGKTNKTFATGNNNDWNPHQVGFDASLVSTIYGSSNTVTPESLRTLFYIRV